jgi:hypothetical protein
VTLKFKPKKMSRSLLILLFISLSVKGFSQEQNCFQQLQKAFADRGSYTIADDIHRKVIIAFFEGDEVYCVNGKVRVVDGRISSVFLAYNDATYELMNQKLVNKEKLPAKIDNGISEMIYASDGQKLRVIFIEKLKPKQKKYQTAVLPDDL